MNSRGIISKKIFGAAWIFAAIIIVLLSYPEFGGFLYSRDFKDTVPNVSQMATSPAAIELLRGKISVGAENQTPAVENNGGNEKEKSEYFIHIPKINVFVPIVTAKTADAGQLGKLLDFGAVIYPGSAGFGNLGQTVLLGHSAPADWPNIRHDTAFSRISELVWGDAIKIVYNGETFDYSVNKKQVIDKGGDFSGAPAPGSVLILLSCWPPGRDSQRLAVEAVLVDK